VAFAEKHGMKVRGHTLVWHLALPKWVDETKLSHEELTAALRDHIRTEMTHFRGRLCAWDVVNEALEDDGTPRDTVWRRALGPDYLDQVYRWAHEADPKTKLFYNDYNAEGLGVKSDAVYALVKGMKERGVPIHGVGLQMHLLGGPPPPVADVAANMKRLAALGLEIHVTELDVAIQDMKGTEAERLAEQAQIYRQVLETCLSQPACKALVMWGFTDAHTWIPEVTNHPDAPLIFDEEYRPKPAYIAMREALAR
jgi:endo-1,4-beta-xylanase